MRSHEASDTPSSLEFPWYARPDLSGEIRVKGTTLLNVLAAIQKVEGEVADDLVRKLDGDLATALQTKSIISAGWYPVAWHRRLLGGVVEHGGSIELSEVVRTSTRESMSSIHRLVVKMFSPETLLKQSSRIFSSFFEGTLGVASDAPGVVRIEWKHCVGFDKTCWQAQVLTVDELVAMTGARVRGRQVLAGGGDADANMALELRWIG
jgi:hypothetical protein